MAAIGLKRSFGIIFKAGGSSGTAISDTISITPPQLKVDTQDISTHDQGSIYRLHGSTLADYGEVEFECGLNYQNYTTLNALIASDSESWFISVPGSGAAAAVISYTFTGTLSELAPDALPIDGRQILKGKIKVSGNVTFAGLS